MSTDESPTVPVPEGVTVGDLPRPEGLPATRVQQGYRTDQVDALIDAVFLAVREGRPAPSIADAKFDATRLARRGYAEDAVDDYLDKLAEAVGQAPTPEPGETPEGGPTHEVT